MRKNMSYLDDLKRRIGSLEVQKAMRYQDMQIKAGDHIIINKSEQTSEDEGSVYSIYTHLYEKERDQLNRMNSEEYIEHLIIENFWEQ